jgi:ABC-type antimicrobial peptide transport system permease subunit
VRAADGLAPASLTRSVASAIANVDRNLSVSFQTVSDHLRPHYIRERLLALSAGFFGALALLLASVGLYGVTAHWVGQRRAEIGIRIALGADRRGVVRLVFGRIAALAGIGVTIGVLTSVWASRLVETLLFNTPARDPLMLVGCALLLVLICGVAGWLPARRAARIDPAAVLREG